MKIVTSIWHGFKREQNRLFQEALQLGGELSNIRRAAADRLSIAIETELRQLQMERTTFRVELNQQVEGDSYRLFAGGIDEAAFLIAPNPGEPLKPLNKIASGGEMSQNNACSENDICID